MYKLLDKLLGAMYLECLSHGHYLPWLDRLQARVWAQVWLKEHRMAKR